MTEEQFKVKIEEMANNSKPYLEKEALRLFHSGVVNVEGFEDDYVLPKLILSVALENAVWQYRPFPQKHYKELAKLRLF